MRQPRIKRESDPSQPPDSDPLSPQYLSVPGRVERQCSEPLPSHSPPPGNLLTVPGPVLHKQHSHPLLPSQQPKSVKSPNVNNCLFKTLFQMSPPLHIQIVPQNIPEATQRAVSPVVVVTETLTVDNAATAPTGSLRVRSDELRRSASSPQVCRSFCDFNE